MYARLAGGATVNAPSTYLYVPKSTKDLISGDSLSLIACPPPQPCHYRGAQTRKVHARIISAEAAVRAGAITGGIPFRWREASFVRSTR
jgi:hypothetical protein